ncbi:hypothetical protein R5W23_005887 [Gemmata sp. JC673]|uniref:Uncharacterized protein n=1 Tax=Gemmata algarum TaxID=2975278 RepID=A0ABU5EU47_9BACT|nr:hypothetical protein [Gemmata algarum]MDY3558730.1 hypothetical protein [Gemmata algarum]
MTRFATARRAELTRPGALPAEKMLVDRAVACALQVEYFSAMEANAIEGGEPAKLLQWRAKRHAQAQRAFQTALASLLTAQKLFPADAAKVATSLPPTEAEPVTVPIPEATPASLPVEVEEHHEDAAYQSTGWIATGDQATASQLLSVRN